MCITFIYWGFCSANLIPLCDKHNNHMEHGFLCSVKGGGEIEFIFFFAIKLLLKE